MYIRIAVIAICMMLPVNAAWSGSEVLDSTGREKDHQKSNLKFTARLHSIGLFGYSGRIVSDHPAFDVNLTYERRAWSMAVIKVVDLYDAHNQNNFALASIFKNFRAGKRITITPYAGVALEQNEKIAGHGSDAIVLLITTCKLDEKVSVEHTAMFSNLVVEAAYFGWLNRVRVLYKHDHVDLAVTGWHNNKVFDKNEYVSAGFYAAYSRIKVSDKVMLTAGVTTLFMIQTSDQALFPKKNGLMLTIAAVVD